MTIDWNVVSAEGVKLVAQFVGALLIARLTVYWALRRFKSEKAWERQSSALADYFHGMHEMQEVNYLRLKLAYESAPETEYSKELDQRYKLADTKIRGVTSTAHLIRRIFRMS